MAERDGPVEARLAKRRRQPRRVREGKGRWGEREPCLCTTLIKRESEREAVDLEGPRLAGVCVNDAEGRLACHLV
jgi:hypothetical protein